MENLDHELDHKSEPTTSQIKIPVIEEYIDYDTEQHQTGKVRITKQIHEETIDVDDSVTQEKVEIDHIAINQFIDVAPPAVRYEDNVMIVPVLKEVWVKRLFLVEELHVRKVKETETQKKQVTLRKEEVHIHRQEKD